MIKNREETVYLLIKCVHFYKYNAGMIKLKDGI